MNHNSPAILTYHSIDDSGSVISLKPETFRAQIHHLVRHGIPVAPLREAPSRPGSVAITFDDGFRNFYQCAFPVLCEYRLPATVFVVSGYCGRANDWPSQPAAGIPKLPLMGWSELQEISRYGIDLGVHTVNHPRLTGIPEREVLAEFRSCREEIEARTGKPADTMAYPYGDSNRPVRQCARQAGFEVACGTSLAKLASYSDPMDLPRLDMYYFQKLFWFRSLWSLHGRGYLAVRRSLRAIRAGRPQ